MPGALDITRIRWVSDPQTSPDGRRVAFVETLFTDPPHGVSAPAWAPGGSQLGFVAKVGPRPPEGGEKSRTTRIITTLKYRYKGEGFTCDLRPHVFVVARNAFARNLQLLVLSFTAGFSRAGSSATATGFGPRARSGP